MKRVVLFILLFSNCVSGLGQLQTTPLIDSLEAEVLKVESDEDKIDIYNNIAFQYLFVDSLGTLDYIDKVKTESENIGYSQGIARALNIHAIHHSFQGRYDMGIVLNEKALTYCEKEDHKVLGKIHNGLGLAYQRQYVVDKCLDHYHKALFHASEVKDTVTISVVLGNIAGVQSTQGNDKEAKKYFLQLEKVASNYKDQNVQFAFHVRFAEFLTQTEEYEESDKFLDRALANSEILKHNSKIRKVRLQFAINSLNARKFEMADIHLDELIDPKVDPNRHTFMRYDYWKSDLEHSKKDYEKAVYYANRGLDKIQNYKDFYFYKPRLLKILHESANGLDNHKDAYRYLTELQSWQDSVDLKEREDKFIELESKYQSEKKAIENALLKEQSLNKTVKLRQRTFIAIGALMTLILSLILAYLLYRNAKKEKINNILLESKVEERTQRLRKSNEELERFAYIASHDLKEPVTTIKGFIKLLEQDFPIDYRTDEVDSYISFIEKSSDQMLYLINGILDYTKLGNNVTKTEVNLNDILKKVEIYLYRLIAEKNAVIISEKMPIVTCNSILIFQIFKNLIENGIKFNESEKCVIEIEYIDEPDHLILNFKDNGIGIPKEKQEQVFEMFARLNNRSDYKGAGLGLSIVKNLTKLIEGDITLIKSDTHGSIFSVRIPKGDKVLN